MSESEKCGLGSILPLACRGRAEAFARRLHSRLRSLSGDDADGGGGGGDGSADETSWLASDDGPVVALSQPHVRHQEELYLDFGLLESPPDDDDDDEDQEAQEKRELLNEDALLGRGSRCRCGARKRANSVDDSDSDGPFYDSEDRTYCNGDAQCPEATPSLDDVPEEDVPKCPVEITVNGAVDSEPETNSKVNGIETDDDDDGEEERSPRVRRCSSLKTGKTPPGTPGSKKIVRFADALGLDLAAVRTFLDEIPKVPTSAYEYLSFEPCCDASPKLRTVTVDKILVPLFQQPGGLLNFLDLVRERQVCLENAVVDDPSLLSVRGFVRVRNLDFHKSVYVRYSLNSWRSFADVQATYVDNSCDGFSDKFAFVLYAHTLSVGQKLEFACRFQCRGCQYWDNNLGKNYCFQCLPATSGPPQGAAYTQADDWGGASFYY